MPAKFYMVLAVCAKCSYERERKRTKDVRRCEFIPIFTYGPTILRWKILDVKSCVEFSVDTLMMCVFVSVISE